MLSALDVDFLYLVLIKNLALPSLATNPSPSFLHNHLLRLFRLAYLDTPYFPSLGAHPKHNDVHRAGVRHRQLVHEIVNDRKRVIGIMEIALEIRRVVYVGCGAVGEWWWWRWDVRWGRGG